MASVQLIGTAWTVWNMARKRFGPVGALLVTAAVIAGLVYLRPRLTEKFPALEAVVGDAKREQASE